MTTDQAITIALNLPSIALLGGIFYRLGGAISTLKEHSEDITALWNGLNKLREHVHGISG